MLPGVEASEEYSNLSMSGSVGIESIAIEKYRCLRKTGLNKLSRMLVVVGANRSGKSSLSDVFAFLKVL